MADSYTTGQSISSYGSFGTTSPTPSSTTYTLGQSISEFGSFQSPANTKTSYFSYRYPLTKLTSADDYLKIDIFDYIPPGFESASGNFALPSSDTVGYNNPIGTIMLPVPESIGDNNYTNWGPSEFNPLQAAAARVAGGVIDAKTAQDALNTMTGEVDRVFKAAKSGTTQKYLQALGISFASNIVLGRGSVGNINEVASRFEGIVVNSNVELVFTGVKLRDGFVFTFDIVPRSKKESDEVKNIIRTFKQASAAKKGVTGAGAAGLFLKAPNVFKIQYMSGGRPHPYLNKFKICALQGVGVDYTGSGTYATYSDATPVNMKLTLAFQELTPIYAEDYDTAEGQQGVGY